MNVACCRSSIPGEVLIQGSPQGSLINTSIRSLDFRHSGLSDSGRSGGVCIYIYKCMYINLCMYVCMSVCLSVCHPKPPRWDTALFWFFWVHDCYVYRLKGWNGWQNIQDKCQMSWHPFAGIQQMHVLNKLSNCHTLQVFTGNQTWLALKSTISSWFSQLTMFDDSRG